jgi:histidinol-phosphate aminotransferase
VKDKLNIQNLVRENIKALSPYSTARDEAGESFEIYLDANENPFNNGYNRYPDPRQKELKSLISQIKRVPFDNIFLGNGSDEAIDILYRVFCNPGADNVVSIAPTYGMYKVAASINNVEYREVQLNNDFSLNVEDILSKVDTNTKLLFLCSPNNPTGNRFVTKDILTVLELLNGLNLVRKKGLIYYTVMPQMKLRIF